MIFSFIGINYAQNSVKADRLYKDLAYKETINFYATKDQLSAEDMERIANSYRLNHDTENAALWYGQVVEQNSDPINTLYYAQALQSNGDYEKAKEYFLKYGSLVGNGNDSRGIQLAAAIDRMNEWKNEEEIILKAEKNINSPNLDFSPAFYKDGIVFVSSRKNANKRKYKWTGDHFMNLFYATQNKEGELEEVTSFSKMINSKYHEGPVAFSKSYDKIFFTRNDHVKGKMKKSKKGVLKLGIFTSMSNGENWTTPQPVAFNTPEHEECHPSLSADGSRLYFASDRPGGEGGMDIYVSEFEGGKWAEPINMGPSVNTPGNEVFPFIHDDGTLYFASDGWGGLGGLDIFKSVENGEGIWKDSENLGTPYNSRKDDFGFVMNVLGTEGYLNSSRDGGVGKDDIYSFKKNIAAEEKPKNNIVNGQMDPNGNITIYQFINNDFKGTPNEVQSAIQAIQDHAEESDDKRVVVMMGENKIESPKVVVPEPVVEVAPPVYVAPPAPVVPPTPVTPPANIVIAPPPVIEVEKAPVEIYEKKDLKVGETIILKNVYYGFNKQEPNKRGEQELDKLVRFMNDNPTLKIELSSHTDARGRTRYNTWLSRKRAEAATAYITKKGIQANRIAAKGYGETQLINKCADGIECEEAEHKMNRRTEIKILKL